MKLFNLFRVLRDPIRAYVALAVLYILLILLLPANTAALERYQLTPGQYHILLLILVLPYIAVWFSALFGYSRLRNYTRLIRQAPEGEHFARISSGVRWLAYGLPITAIISILLNSITNEYAGFKPISVITNNYLSLLIPLIGFIYISLAAKGLTAQARLNTSSRSSKLLTIVFITMGVVYSYFTLQYFDMSSITSADNPYFLPIWLMLLTLIIPFLYSWFIGFLAAYELILYSWHAQGLLYKQALRQLGIGLAIVIVSFILLQYVTTVVPRSGSLSLNSLFIIVYLIRFIMAAGFVAIVLGANKLKRIEEV